MAGGGNPSTGMSAGEPLERGGLTTSAGTGTARRPAGAIAPVKVALVTAMCLVCGMLGLLGGVLASGAHVTELFQTVTDPGQTVTHVRTHIVASTVRSPARVTTQVVTRPPSTVVKTDILRSVSTVTVTTSAPPATAPPTSSVGGSP
jgi:hypothetical protein